MPTEFTVNAQDCLIGQILTSNSTCISCGTGFYLFEVGQADAQCKICESDAICYGGSRTAPKPGFWRESEFTNNYIPCTYGPACLGGNIKSPLTICEKGYSGTLCSNCDSDYHRVGFYNCQKCRTLSTSILFYCLQLFSLLVAIIVLARSSFGNSSD